MRQKITCPDSAHLEEIEYTEDPVDGTILGVHRCTRFHPSDTVDCDGLCAQRLNKRLESLHERGKEQDQHLQKEQDQHLHDDKEQDQDAG
jgi:hypothetical protein